MSSENSNIEFYSPDSSKKAIEVDRHNLLFVIHRRGFVTCLCEMSYQNTLVIYKLILKN